MSRSLHTQTWKIILKSLVFITFIVCKKFRCLWPIMWKVITGSPWKVIIKQGINLFALGVIAWIKSFKC